MRIYPIPLLYLNGPTTLSNAAVYKQNYIKSSDFWINDLIWRQSTTQSETEKHNCHYALPLEQKIKEEWQDMECPTCESTGAEIIPASSFMDSCLVYETAIFPWSDTVIMVIVSLHSFVQLNHWDQVMEVLVELDGPLHGISWIWIGPMGSHEYQLLPVKVI